MTEDLNVITLCGNNKLLIFSNVVKYICKETKHFYIYSEICVQHPIGLRLDSCINPLETINFQRDIFLMGFIQNDLRLSGLNKVL